jgi:hypothetical protein
MLGFALAASVSGAALAQDAVKIGLILPMTGPFASTGRQIAAAANFYIQEKGATVAGKKVELIVKDDTGTADVTRRIAQELIVNDKVTAIAGFGLTPLALATAPDGALAAASIAAVSDGYLHYYLSGSADSQLRDSPMKNVVAALAAHSSELGLPLNLGGGISRGDALEEFKRGFANREQTWHSSEIVCDPSAYERLAAGREAGGFFPAYRA